MRQRLWCAIGWHDWYIVHSPYKDSRPWWRVCLGCGLSARGTVFGWQNQTVNAHMVAACQAALDWRGLDGDGISDPTREQLIAAIAKAEGRS